MIGKVRKSKWQRIKNPAAIVLQPRDRYIITQVYEFGFLTREQVQRIFGFNCIVRANIRLRKLFDHGYLSRRLFPSSKGSLKAMYFLGPKGIAIISEEKGLDALEIRRRQQNLAQKKELFLNHDLTVNEVRIAFTQAIENHERMNLDRWLLPMDCAQEVSIFNAKLKRTIRGVFRPDGYFRYVYNGKLYGCFLEMDMSTMSNSRFKSKVSLYLHYAQSGLYQKRFGLRFFRVLVVANSEERLNNLKEVTGQITHKIFWFSVSDNMTPDKVFSQIWQRPGRDGTFSLLEA